MLARGDEEPTVCSRQHGPMCMYASAERWRDDALQMNLHQNYTAFLLLSPPLPSLPLLLLALQLFLLLSPASKPAIRDMQMQTVASGKPLLLQDDSACGVVCVRVVRVVKVCARGARMLPRRPFPLSPKRPGPCTLSCNRVALHVGRGDARVGDDTNRLAQRQCSATRQVPIVLLNVLNLGAEALGQDGHGVVRLHLLDAHATPPAWSQLFGIVTALCCNSEHSHRVHQHDFHLAQTPA